MCSFSEFLGCKNASNMNADITAAIAGINMVVCFGVLVFVLNN